MVTILAINASSAAELDPQLGTLWGCRMLSAVVFETSFAIRLAKYSVDVA